MPSHYAEQTRTALYRHFDADGRLLYVGISLNAVARLCQHRRDAHWFGDIARIDIEWHPSRTAADKAEREAIVAECPLHNVAHAPTLDPALAAMLRKAGQLHMVDSRGWIKPEYMRFAPGEVEALADRL